MGHYMPQKAELPCFDIAIMNDLLIIIYSHTDAPNYNKDIPT